MSRALIQKLAEAANSIEMRLAPTRRRSLVLFLFAPSWLDQNEVLAEHLRLHPKDEAEWTICSQLREQNQSAWRNVAKREERRLGREAVGELRFKRELDAQLATTNLSSVTGKRCIAFAAGVAAQAHAFDHNKAIRLLGKNDIDTNEKFIAEGFSEGVEWAKRHDCYNYRELIAHES